MQNSRQNVHLSNVKDSNQKNETYSLSNLI